MPTDGREDLRLEDRFISVLELDTPLADGLRERLTDLIRWLAGKTATDRDGDDLLAALMMLRDRDPARVSRSGLRAGRRETAPAAGSAGAGNAAREAGEDEAPGGQPFIEAGTAQASTAEAGADVGEALTAEAGGDGTEPAAEPTPADLAAEGLAQLWALLRDDPQAGQYCAIYEAEDAPSEEHGPASGVRWLWRHLHMVCLRLPQEMAETYREQAVAAVTDAGYPDPLPPPLPGIPQDADPGQAELRGLSAVLDRWPGLAGLVLCLNWLAWHDAGVQVAHYETYALGIAPFTDRMRERYTKMLTDVLRELGKAELGTAHEAEQLAQLDAMLRGVVPTPLPVPGSWWTSALDESKERLRSHPAADRVVRVLPMTLHNAEEWRRNFGDDPVTISAEMTPGRASRSGERVWILRYPVQRDNGTLQKGRHISVK